MKISFVIVNYQSEKYLTKCVSSIREKILNVDYEIIVVNNDDLDIQCPNETRLINAGENIGFGAACNLGAKEAQGEILCFLNPDTEIVSTNISDLLSEFDKNNKLAIVGPKLISDKNEVQWWIAGKEITVLSMLLNNLGYKRDKKIWGSKISIECAWVSGAALFIKRETFQKLGGFDEKFFMYFEDVDLCKRARMAGYKVLYYPGFVIKHFGGKSFINKKKQKKYYHTSQYRYFKKSFCTKTQNMRRLGHV